MPQISERGTAIIVFDDVCVLCNAWVDFLLRHDHQKRYRFSAMQTEAGRAFLKGNALDPDDPASFLLIDEDGMHTKSDAILRVVAGLGGVWRLVVVARVLPRSMRDSLYHLVARMRYRLFGKRSQCRLPDPAHRHRFLD